ncbi:MAG: hypothetical protein PHS49_07410 [Candidatus Gracilibacteria bacterium]|nr:hypothetical protein [Candidatus Gracilibacteria bacterium]
MGIENNSSFESIPSQIHTQSEEEAKKTVNNIENLPKLRKINDILVLFEGKIDENDENLEKELSKLLNNQSFEDLDSFSKDKTVIQDIENLNEPSEIINYLNNKFNNKTKGGGSIDYSNNLTQINSQIDSIKAKIKAIEEKQNFGENDKDFDDVDALNKELNTLEVSRREAAIKAKQDTREAVIETKIVHSFEQDKLLKDMKNIKDSLPNEILDKHSNIKNLLDKSATTPDTPEGNTEKEEYLKQIIKILKNPETLNSVAKDLQEYDKQNGTHNYESFKTSLISIDSSFREKFPIIDGFGDSEKLAKLGTSSDKGLKQEGDYINQTDNGLNIQVGIDGRKISLSDSQYRLNSNLQNDEVVQEINDKKQEFSKFMEGLNSELNTLSSLLEMIDQAIYDNLDINEAKQQIKTTNPDTYTKYNLDSYSNLTDMKNALDGVYKLKEDEKDLLVRGAKKVITEILERNAKKAKEADEKKKDTLAFLKSIGFDKIDQSITDNIINQLNSNTGLRNMLGFNGVIDLENGSLGTNADADNQNVANQEKVNFAKMFNIMLSGKPDGILNIDNLQNARGNPISDMTKLNIIKLIQNINVGTKLCSIFFAHFLTKPLQLC